MLGLARLFRLVKVSLCYAVTDPKMNVCHYRYALEIQEASYTLPAPLKPNVLLRDPMRAAPAYSSRTIVANRVARKMSKPELADDA